MSDKRTIEEMRKLQDFLSSVPGWPQKVDAERALEAVHAHLKKPCDQCERRSYSKIAKCISLPHRVSGEPTSLKSSEVKWAIRLLGDAGRVGQQWVVL